jgi:hypothetical protein
MLELVDTMIRSGALTVTDARIAYSPAIIGRRLFGRSSRSARVSVVHW